MGVFKTTLCALAALALVDARWTPDKFKRQTEEPYPACETPRQKKEWRTLSDEQKASFIKAQQCIMTSPAKLGTLPGAETRWDEMVSLHQINALQIHSTGTFLPYHRYYLKVHEALLAECGYMDPAPWWDETLDAGAFSESPLFDPELGFGGSGVGREACLEDGPYVNMTVRIGPGFTTEPRCVNRRITDGLSGLCGLQAVVSSLEHETYGEVYPPIYSGPHLYGHMALSMMNGDSITSSGDPLFFMHHGFVDKMWWDWQARDLEARTADISGNNAQLPSIGFTEFPGGMAAESRMWGTPTAEMEEAAPDPEAGDDGPETTLGHILSSNGIIPDATIADVMDIQGGYLCYEFVDAEGEVSFW